MGDSTGTIFIFSVVVGLAGAAYWYFNQERRKTPKQMGCLESKPDPAEAPEAKKAKVETAVPATNSAKTEAKPSAKASAVAKEVADLQAKIKAYEDKMKALKAAKKPNDDPELVDVKNELKKANTELAGHFMFSKLKGQVCIKEPGTINGQMFIIEDCEDCDIYVCDYTAQVQIDYNKNCRIFVGPSESSVFIRNCTDCKCIIACQQYRARECENCDTLLFASTAPVVESSKNMRFGCFRFFYFNLAHQFKAVKMSVYDNKWSEVYDFTPSAVKNFSFLPLDTKGSDLVKPLSAVGASFVSKEEDATHSDTEVVPLTVGIRGQEFAGMERAFLLVLPAAVDEAAETMFSKLGAGLHIIQTKQLKLTAERCKELFKKCGKLAIAAAAVNGMCVGVEIAGTGALAAAQGAVAHAGGDSEGYASADAEAAAFENNLFFEQWRDFAGTSVTR